MPKITTKPAIKTLVPAPAIVLFGLDDTDKPRAARFTGEDADLVAKAAALMKLAVCTATTPELAEIAKKLPIGRLHASGRGFVPNVRRDLHARLVEAVGRAGQAAAQPETATAAAPSGNGVQGAQAKPPAAPRSATGTKAPAAAYGLPRTWDEIAPGHLVVAQESLEEGWWEAIVVERTGDLLTLRWRDYPKVAKFARHLATIALMKPGVA
jgi:hypothetical protein